MNPTTVWYEHDAEEAALFYAKTIPDTAVGAVMRAPGHGPSYGCALRLDQVRFGALLGHARKTLRFRASSAE